MNIEQLLAEVEPVAWIIKRDLMAQEYVTDKSLADLLNTVEDNDVRPVYSKSQVLALLTAEREARERAERDEPGAYPNITDIAEANYRAKDAVRRAEAAEAELKQYHCPIGMEDSSQFCSAGYCYKCLGERFDIARQMNEAAEARLKEAEAVMREIMSADPVENMLDPQRPARIAYNKAALELFGGFAKLNDIAVAPSKQEDDIPEFKPCVIVYLDSGISEMLLEDCPTITGEEMTVRPLRRMAEDKAERDIIGFQWKTASGPSKQEGGDK